MHKQPTMKYSGYWLSIVEMNPDNHVLHTFLSCNLSFSSLSPVTSLITPTNDGPVLIDLLFRASRNNFKTTPNVRCSKIITPQSTLLCKTLYSNVVIAIDNYLDTYHLTP